MEKIQLTVNITARKYTDFLISEYIISNDSELSFDNINILNPFIQIKQTQISVTLILIIFTFIYLIIMIIFKFRKFLIFKPWQIRIEIEPESNISDIEINNILDNENTLEENIIVELTNQLHSIYPSVPMNRDD